MRLRSRRIHAESRQSRLGQVARRRVSAAHVGWVRAAALPQGAPCPPVGHCAGAGQSAQEAQSHWVSWRATSSRRSQPHRCCPRPQRPAAICDSRTGRRTRPAPDWQLPRRWAHILETPEQTAPPVVVNLISPPPPRWGEAGRRVWALARALMARR